MLAHRQRHLSERASQALCRSRAGSCTQNNAKERRFRMKSGSVLVIFETHRLPQPSAACALCGSIGREAPCRCRSASLLDAATGIAEAAFFCFVPWARSGRESLHVHPCCTGPTLTYSSDFSPLVRPSPSTMKLVRRGCTKAKLFVRSGNSGRNGA